jgi:hypothetical protein
MGWKSPMSFANMNMSSSNNGVMIIAGRMSAAGNVFRLTVDLIHDDHSRKTC